MQEEEARRPAGEPAWRAKRRALPPIFFLQERGLQLLRSVFQHRENEAQGRDHTLYDPRWTRVL